MLNNRTVMIIEDSALTRRTLVAHLREAGFSAFLEASTYQEAVRVSQDNTPDIILVDLILPDGNGRDLIELFRQQQRFADTPILVITSMDDEREALECFNAGADDYIRKPWHRMELAARLTNYLERKLARQALVRSESLAAVGTLAAGVAHNFNNVLSGVRGYTELAMRAPELTDKTRDRLSKAYEGILRAVDLTAKLLDVARVDRPARQLAKLSNVVVAVAELLRPEFDKHSVELELRLTDNCSLLLAVPELGQVLMHLLRNARHAVLDREERKVAVETREEPEQVIMTVEDNGCGIAAEDLNRIFLPFFTRKGEFADQNSGQHAVRGPGLGLSICRNIVREHGGEISVQSTPGKGSVFTVTLPRPEHAKPRPSGT